MSHYFVVVVAYNEENTLNNCIESAFESALFYRKINANSVCDVIICHNGCTDNTPIIAEKIKNKYTKNNIFRVKVISSSKGMVIAQTASINYIRRHKKYLNDPIVFIDADALIDKKTIFLLLNQYKKHSKLKAVGARPIPIPYKGELLMEKIWEKIFNCRSYFPKSEIALNPSLEYHPYADSDPQPNYVDFEKKSKIYFHGRCFSLRDQFVWDVPENNIGEDTYLDRSIHYRFGPGSIRNIYDAKIYFNPITGLRCFVKTFYRIYNDLILLKKLHPEYDNIREYSKTTLDWEYIKTLSVKWWICFKIYYCIRQICHFLFKHNLIFRGKPALFVWSYDKK